MGTEIKSSNGAQMLRLTFTRRAFTRGIDFQPFVYDIEVTWKLFKKVMSVAAMGMMGFWMKGTSKESNADDTLYQPNPNVETILHSRAQSAQASSRSDAGENGRLRGCFVRLQRDMTRNPKLNSTKLFSVSTTQGHPLSMSQHKGYFT